MNLNKNFQKKKYTINSLETYNLAMHLRRGGLGGENIHKKLAEIGRIVQVGTIEGWLYRNKKPFAVKIIKQISSTSNALTQEKSYVIGTICGDGYISTEYRIGLSVCDKEFATYFKYCLEKTYGVTCSISERMRNKTNMSNSPRKQYVVSLVSKLIVEDLQTYTKSFKTKDWRVPEQILNSTEEIQSTFIMGFADSEGSVRVRKGNGEITLNSTNKEGLIEVQYLLSKIFNINSSLFIRDKIYYISIRNYDSLKKFYDKIGFVIKRKQEALNQVLNSYKRKGLRRHSEEDKILAIQLLKQGLEHRQIAKLLETSCTNIYDWEKKFIKDVE